jgi:hypothetical protein
MLVKNVVLSFQTTMLTVIVLPVVMLTVVAPFKNTDWKN